MTDFLSSASRHWDHSTFLASHHRYQEAAYLAGYAAECALKALVEQAGLEGRPFGHSLVNLSGDGLELALLLSPLLRRYQVESVMQEEGLGKWRETHRYEKTDFLPDADFQQIVADAETVTQLILVGFTLDGLLEDIPK